MTRRARRLLKFMAIAYIAALAAFVYGANKGRSRGTRPELIPKRLTIIQREQITGWRAEERFEEAKQKIVLARYRMRAAQAGLEAGQLIDAEALAKLVEANPGTVLVWDPRLCLEFAARRAESGEEIKDPNGNVIVRVGEVLDEDRLVAMALALDPQKGAARHEKLWIRGAGRFYFFDLTCVFVAANFLLLAAVLYPLLWEPVQRLLADRSLAIRGEVEAARRSREEAEAVREATKHGQT
jgi:hypothetical protein